MQREQTLTQSAARFHKYFWPRVLQQEEGGVR